MSRLSNFSFFLLLGIIYAIAISFLVYNHYQEHQETLAELSSREKILLVGNGGEPANLDPAFCFHIKDGRILRAIFECLLILDPKTLSPRPGVAKDWEVSLDGLTYTFYLRDNARFSNGDPVTAHDFVFSFQRMLSPKVDATNAMFLDEVKNVKKYKEGTISDFNEVGIKALDDYTLQFKLETSNPFFSALLAYWIFVPLHRSTLEKFNAVETVNNDWLSPENFVGNGPFTLKKWQPYEYIEVEKNPYYWNAEQVKLNKVRFYVMETAEKEAHAFFRGELHVTSALSSKDAANCVHDGNSCLRSIELTAVEMYIFNTNIWPLNDTRVRQALSIGINRVNLVNNVINGVFAADRKIAYNIIGGVISNYQPSFFIKEDIEKAQQLLAEAGFPNGKGFPHLRLVVPDEETYIGVAKAVQDMWRRHLNIGVEIIKINKAYLWNEIFNKKDYDILRIGWLNDASDLTGAMKYFARQTWNDPDFESLLELARKTPDVPTRCKYIGQAEEVLIKKAPLMPLFFHVYNYLIDPSVQGWHSNALLVNYYQFIDLKNDE